jgi:hypothetical protein
MEIDITKHKITPIDIRLSYYSDSYLFEDFNPSYGYFLRATVHIPNGRVSNVDRLDYRFSKIYVHRCRITDAVQFERNVEEGESELVYKGLIESDEDLTFLLSKLGITH